MVEENRNAFEREFGELFEHDYREHVPQTMEELKEAMTQAENDNEAINEKKLPVTNEGTAEQALTLLLEKLLTGTIQAHPETAEDTFSLMIMVFLTGLDIGRLDPNWAVKIRAFFIKKEERELNDRGLRLLLRLFPIENFGK